MIDWMLLGVLGAVLVAEVLDALALHGLVRGCRALPAGTAPVAVAHEVAEGFDHSRRLTGWLRTACLVLAGCCLVGAAQPLLVVASLVLAAGAHCESGFSAALGRQFVDAVAIERPICVAATRTAARRRAMPLDRRPGDRTDRRSRAARGRA